MEKEWFTVAEIEKETNIPHQTIRRYIKVHGHHFVLKKKHKSYFISEKSIKVILNIRNMYSEGKTSEQVEEYLANSGIPVIIDVKSEDEQVSINFPEVLLELKSDMSSVNEKLSEQENFNQLLIEKLSEQNEFIKKQQKYIDEKLSKRDEALVRSMRELLESKKQIAVTEQSKKKWWLFWR